jgi:hypothetical protein
VQTSVTIQGLFAMSSKVNSHGEDYPAFIYCMLQFIIGCSLKSKLFEYLSLKLTLQQPSSVVKFLSDSEVSHPVLAHPHGHFTNPHPRPELPKHIHIAQ